MDKVADIIGNKKKLQEMIEYYSQVVDLLPDEAHGYLNRGFNYFLDNQFVNAENDFTKVIDLEPDNIVAFCLRGFSRDKNDKHTEAMEDFIRALEIDPRFAEAYVGMGLMKAKRAKYKESIKYFDRAIEIDSNNEKAYVYRGNASYHSKKYDQAISDYLKAIDINQKTEKEVAMKLGEASFKRGMYFSEREEEYEQAVNCFSLALKYLPARPEIYLYRAEAYMYLENNEDAKKDLQKVISLDPKGEAGNAASEMMDILED